MRNGTVNSQRNIAASTTTSEDSDVLLFNSSDKEADDPDSDDEEPESPDENSLEAREQETRAQGTEISSSSDQGGHLPRRKVQTEDTRRHLLHKNKMSNLTKLKSRRMRTVSLSQGKGAKSPTTSEDSDDILFSSNDDDADDPDNDETDPETETRPNDTSGNQAKHTIPNRSFNDSESFSSSD